MQVLGCLTGSWAPAGKVTVSGMLIKCLPIASQECFGMFLPSLSAIPFCKSLGSSLPVFSRCVHMLLSGLTVSPPSGRHCLTQSIWGEQADSSLLPGCSFLYTKVECAAYAINSKQMNQIVLQPVRGYKIFWVSCLPPDLQVRYMLWLLDAALPGSPAAVQWEVVLHRKQLQHSVSPGCGDLWANQ